MWSRTREVFTEVIGFFDECQDTTGERQTNSRHPPQARFHSSSSAPASKGTTWRENVSLLRIATDLENLKANLKGSTCPKGERGMAWEHVAQQKTVNAFKLAQNNNAKDVQMGANRGGGGNRHNHTGYGDRRPRQDGDKQLCGYCGMSKHQSRDQCPGLWQGIFKKMREAEAISSQSEPSRKGAVEVYRQIRSGSRSGPTWSIVMRPRSTTPSTQN